MDYSIDQVSKKIFINKDYLIAIEKGDYTIFPSKVFAKAYFKKYDAYLGINSDFPNIFEQDIPKRNTIMPPEFKLNKSFKEPKVFINSFINISWNNLSLLLIQQTNCFRC